MAHDYTPLVLALFGAVLVGLIATTYRQAIPVLTLALGTFVALVALLKA